ncbi:hypothetical protein Pcinc_013996 [Petrolisthes cinctipes]|uniref:Uncharacterized protein n=1 Tax=Petrolisthes cinctipes TaxID=88211 RepID=A0AAE1FXW3_PETCI|nr:hypothetical protein Pcinc_013996 [Petrolisthes cinctipes]
MEEDRKSFKVSTDSPLPHAGDEEVTGGDVGEREGEVVGDTTPTYGECQFSDFSPHPLPAFQQIRQMPVLSPHPPQPQPATSTDLLQLFHEMAKEGNETMVLLDEASVPSTPRAAANPAFSQKRKESGLWREAQATCRMLLLDFSNSNAIFVSR